MSTRHLVQGVLTIAVVVAMTLVAVGSVNTDGLALKAASRAGNTTRYTFMGTFTYSFDQNDRTWVTNYEATISARWDASKREATENISYQRIKFEGGKVAAVFDCSRDPFVAIQAEWPQCKRKQLQIDAPAAGEGSGYWQQMLEKQPLTFRRADPAAANAMIAEGSKTEPPPPPAPTPPPKTSPADTPARTTTDAIARTGRPFPNPTWNGRRVDFCLHWSADCGQPAADEFCKLSGYARSVAWTPAEKVGHTLVLGDNKPCNDPRCAGFASVSCAK